MFLRLRTLGVVVGLLMLASGCGRKETPAAPATVGPTSSAAKEKWAADHDPNTEASAPTPPVAVPADTVPHAAEAKTAAEARAPDQDPKKEASPPAPAPAEAEAPREQLAPDTAVLDVELPPGARAALDGKDIGTQRHFVFEKLGPKELASHELVVRHREGQEERRTLLVKRGWQVRLPLPASDLLRPELVLQTGHIGGVGSGIRSVAFSPDGRQVLTAGDSTAILWDAASGRKLRAFQGYYSSVTFSPDGRQLLTVGGNTAILWDAASGQKLRAFHGHTNWLYSVAFSPDGRQVLTGSGDKTAILWDAASGQKLRAFQGHTGTVTSVAFSPDGRQVLTGGDDNTAILWDAASGQKLRAFHGHTFFRVLSVAFSPDGRQVLTGGDDKTAILWDAANGQKLRAFHGHTGQAVYSVAFSPDGRQVLTAGGKTILWDAASGEKLHAFQGYFGNVAAFSPDGRQVLTAGGMTAILWDAASGQKLRAFQGHTGAVYSVAFSPDGRQVLTGSAGMTAILWDAASGQKLRAFQGGDSYLVSSPTFYHSVAFSPDGGQVLTGPGDETAILWDAASVQKLRAFQGHPIWAVAFSPDGRQVLTGSFDKTAILWDAASGQKLRRFQGHTTAVCSVAFSPDGRQVLTGGNNKMANAFNPLGAVRTGSSDTSAILWDAASGQKLRAFQGHTGGVLAVAFSPDGRQVLTAGDSTAILWDAASGQKLRAFQGYYSSVTFSPDGRQLLSNSGDGTACLWDIASGQKLRAFQGHIEGVSSVAFSPDGRQVLTGSGDGTSRLWDIATGSEVARLIHFDGGQDWAVLTAEGLFDGSKGGREKMSFRIGKALDVVPLDRFFQDFYYPGLLAVLWRGERPLPGKSLSTDPAPTLKILVQAADSVRKDQVRVDVAVTDQGGGLKGPWLQHNGVTLRTGSKVRQEGKTAHYRFSVALVAGSNRIEVRAATADGGRESEPAGAVVPFDGKLPEPDLYVLAIGINRFAKNAGISNLEYCVPDAQAVADLFRKRTGKLFNEVHVTALFDDQATREGILKAVTATAAKARAQDTLVLYIASHGIAVGQRFYVIPHDFHLEQGEPSPQTPPAEITTVATRGYRATTDAREAAVRSHGLAIDELGEALAAVPALKRVLIFDTCHSGSAIALAGKKQSPFAFRGAMERFSRAQGVYSLSATAADELAAENKELGHSILTYALLAGLNAGAGGPLQGQPLKGGEGGAVDVLEWFRYARQRVPGLYQRYVGRPQQVELSGEDQPGFPLLILGIK